jgi:hypothetical protein
LLEALRGDVDIPSCCPTRQARTPATKDRTSCC